MGTAPGRGVVDLRLAVDEWCWLREVAREDGDVVAGLLEVVGG